MKTGKFIFIALGITIALTLASSIYIVFYMSSTSAVEESVSSARKNVAEAGKQVESPSNANDSVPEESEDDESHIYLDADETDDDIVENEPLADLKSPNYGQLIISNSSDISAKTSKTQETTDEALSQLFVPSGQGDEITVVHIVSDSTKASIYTSKYKEKAGIIISSELKKVPDVQNVAIDDEDAIEPVETEQALEPAMFHVASELELDGSTMYMDGFSDRVLFLFPKSMDSDSICDFVSVLLARYPKETSGYNISLDGNTVEVLFDELYSEDDVANIFVAIIESCFDYSLQPKHKEVLADISLAKSTENEEPDSDKKWQVAEKKVESTQSDDKKEDYVDSSFEDDDFWADFYISGEDDLLFDDGIYYMELYVNGERRGNINVEMISQVPYLSTAELKQFVSDGLTKEAYSRIFSNADDLLSLDDFEALGVKTSFDAEGYKVYLAFDLDDMPFIAISISSPSYSRFSSREISGSVELEPAVFALKSAYNASLNWSLNEKRVWDYGISLYSYNTLSLYDTFLDFSYFLSYSKNDFDFAFSNYLLRHDFESKMLRLSLGNVSTSLLSPLGTPVGIKLSKSLSYSDNDYVRKDSYEEILAVEKESLVEVFNGDNKIYSKVLMPGNYRLEDFVLYTGLNRVLIRISPTDGSSPIEITKEFSYYSSLLYPGEFYYNLTLATGREKLSSKTSSREGAIGFSLGENFYQYDARNIALSFDFSYGITHSLLLRSAMAVANQPEEKNPLNLQGKLNLELTHASSIGTTRYNLNLTERKESDGQYHLPDIYMHVGHQAATSLKSLSSINASLGFTSSGESSNKSYVFNPALGISGRLGALGYSLGSSLNLNVNSIAKSTYSAYLSASFSPKRNMSIASSLNLNGNMSGNIALSASVYASISFKSGGLSTTMSENRSQTNFNAYSGNHYFSSSIYMPGYKNFDKTISNKNIDFSASYSTSNNYFNLGMNVASSFAFDRLSGSVSLSSSTIFADGYFALSSSLPSSYLLIRQKGALRSNDISLAYTGSGEESRLPKTFSTSLYSSLSSSSRSNVMLYSIDDESISGAKSFALSMPAKRERGYVYTLDFDPLYTVSAIATEDSGELWINGSSPLYSLTIDDSGNINLDIDENNYVFTDESGRFILSDLGSGAYAFDIPSKDGWTLAVLEINGKAESEKDMNIYVEKNEEGLNLPQEYSNCVRFVFSEALSSDDFWEMIWPVEEAL